MTVKRAVSGSFMKTRIVQYLHWNLPSRHDTLPTMKGYGQFCPIAKAAEIFTERWTPLVLRELVVGSTHFNELRRGVPLMSSSLLSQRLKRLDNGRCGRAPADADRPWLGVPSDPGRP